MPNLADMTDAELDEALTRFGAERRSASEARRMVLGRLVDGVLDERLRRGLVEQ